MPVQLFPSVAVTVIVKVPVCVGVPLNTPPVERVKPDGNVLVVVKVVVPVPPLCVNVWLNGAPAVPVLVVGLVTTGVVHIMSVTAASSSSVGVWL